MQIGSPQMYSKLPSLVIGFHGCDKTTFKNTLYKHNHLEQSRNLYDWLGHGIYFWENNLERANHWAVEKVKRGDYKTPSVIGAVIDLGHCLNLTDSAYVPLLEMGYELVKIRANSNGGIIPVNKGGKDLLLRNLDCAVIEQIHDSSSFLGQWNEQTEIEEFDSVRGVFIEGNEVYEGAGFMKKTHVQICIRNLNCIKGYFNPLEPNPYYKMP